MSTPDFGPHTLVVDDEDWTIEHPDDCPQELRGDHGGSWAEWTCPYGALVTDVGCDVFDHDPCELPAGAYPLAWWEEAGDGWERDWDCGIIVTMPEVSS